jgi:hypothetical protein
MPNPRSQNKAVAGATYRHFKAEHAGKLYRVLAIANHTETGQQIVVYTEGDGVTWARDRSQFEDGRFIREDG